MPKTRSSAESPRKCANPLPEWCTSDVASVAVSGDEEVGKTPASRPPQEKLQPSIVEEHLVSEDTKPAPAGNSEPPAKAAEPTSKPEACEKAKQSAEAKGSEEKEAKTAEAEAAPASKHPRVKPPSQPLVETSAAGKAPAAPGEAAAKPPTITQRLGKKPGGKRKRNRPGRAGTPRPEARSSSSEPESALSIVQSGDDLQPDSGAEPDAELGAESAADDGGDEPEASEAVQQLLKHLEANGLLKVQLQEQSIKELMKLASQKPAGAQLCDINWTLPPGLKIPRKDASRKQGDQPGSSGFPTLKPSVAEPPANGFTFTPPFAEEIHVRMTNLLFELDGNNIPDLTCRINTWREPYHTEPKTREELRETTIKIIFSKPSCELEPVVKENVIKLLNGLEKELCTRAPKKIPGKAMPDPLKLIRIFLLHLLKVSLKQPSRFRPSEALAKLIFLATRTELGDSRYCSMIPMVRLIYLFSLDEEHFSYGHRVFAAYHKSMEHSWTSLEGLPSVELFAGSQIGDAEFEAGHPLARDRFDSQPDDLSSSNKKMQALLAAKFNMPVDDIKMKTPADPTTAEEEAAAAAAAVGTVEDVEDDGAITSMESEDEGGADHQSGAEADSKPGPKEGKKKRKRKRKPKNGAKRARIEGDENKPLPADAAAAGGGGKPATPAGKDAAKPHPQKAKTGGHSGRPKPEQGEKQHQIRPGGPSGQRKAKTGRGGRHGPGARKQRRQVDYDDDYPHPHLSWRYLQQQNQLLREVLSVRGGGGGGRKRQRPQVTFRDFEDYEDFEDFDDYNEYDAGE